MCILYCHYYVIAVISSIILYDEIYMSIVACYAQAIMYSILLFYKYSYLSIPSVSLLYVR